MMGEVLSAASPPELPVDAVLALLKRVDELGRMLIARQPTISFTYKSDGTILSALDVEIQREIRDCVLALPFVDASDVHFVGEEEDPECDVSKAVEPGRSNWIVDAIDGTAAYTKGVNTFGISIALVDGGGAPLLGIVHLPAWNRRFDVAWQGRRYTWSGGDLESAPGSSLPEDWSDVATGSVARSYIYANSDLHRRGLETFRGKVRNLGGTAAHLALLAEGSEDPIAVVLSRCQTWDVAAGLALTEAAGMEIRHGVDWQRLRYQDLVSAPDIRSTLPVIVGLPRILRSLEADLKGHLH